MSGLAVASLALTAGTTAASFAQAGKQRKAANKANKAAMEAMESARRRLSVNYSDALSIKKEPYELQREALLNQGAQITEATRGSERGAATGAGKIFAGQQRAQEGVRSGMNAEMQRIEELQVAEDQALRSANVSLDMGELEGAQIAEAQARDMAAQATAEGIQGLGNTLIQGAQMAPLYSKQIGAKKKAAAELKGLEDQKFKEDQFDFDRNVLAGNDATAPTAPNTPDFNSMSRRGFKDWLKTSQGQEMLGSEDFETRFNKHKRKNVGTWDDPAGIRGGKALGDMTYEELQKMKLLMELQGL